MDVLEIPVQDLPAILRLTAATVKPACASMEAVTTNPSQETATTQMLALYRTHVKMGHAPVSPSPAMHHPHQSAPLKPAFASTTTQVHARKAHAVMHPQLLRATITMRVPSVTIVAAAHVRQAHLETVTMVIHVP